MSTLIIIISWQLKNAIDQRYVCLSLLFFLLSSSFLFLFFTLGLKKLSRNVSSVSVKSKYTKLRIHWLVFAILPLVSEPRKAKSSWPRNSTHTHEICVHLIACPALHACFYCFCLHRNGITCSLAALWKTWLALGPLCKPLSSCWMMWQTWWLLITFRGRWAVFLFAIHSVGSLNSNFF